MLIGNQNYFFSLGTILIQYNELFIEKKKFISFSAITTPQTVKTHNQTSPYKVISNAAKSIVDSNQFTMAPSKNYTFAENIKFPFEFPKHHPQRVHALHIERNVEDVVVASSTFKNQANEPFHKIPSPSYQPPAPSSPKKIRKTYLTAKSAVYPAEILKNFHQSYPPFPHNVLYSSLAAPCPSLPPPPQKHQSNILVI